MPLFPPSFGALLILTDVSTDTVGGRGGEPPLWVKRPLDLQTTALQIKTDSPATAKGDEMVYIHFYTADEVYAGRFFIRFYSPPKYYFVWCKESYSDFPTTLPSDVNKMWQLTKHPGICVGCREQRGVGRQDEP